MSTASAGAKVALVLDVGGRGDLSFNDMGFKGSDEAQANLGVEVVGIERPRRCLGQRRLNREQSAHVDRQIERISLGQ